MAGTAPRTTRTAIAPLRKSLVLALAFEIVVVAAAIELSARADTSAEAWAWAEALHDSWCRASARG